LNNEDLAMDIAPLNCVNLAAPLNSVPASREDPAVTRQIITAVRALNEAELMGPNRQLTYTRDTKTQQPVIQVIERTSGDVVDQLPPEAILRLRQQLEERRTQGES
jgi:uncharacterized FlaG/YvyC family protein